MLVHLFGMALGGFGPDNLLTFASRESASHRLLNAELIVFSALCVAGIGVLAFRGRDAGPPLRRSIALLVEAFALALVMIAFLYLSAVFGLVSGETPFETIRRATFFVVGLAPLVFLVGLLHARLARSAVGDLIVELRADPTPADLRDALSRALRDPSLTLVYWLPEFETYAGLDGRPAELAGRGRRARDDADRPRRRARGGAAARPVTRRRARAPGRGDGRGRDRARERAAARRASRSPRGAARLARADGGRGQQGAAAAGAQPSRRRAAAAGRALPRAESARRASWPATRRRRSGSTRARHEIAASLAELREIARGIHPAVVSGHGLGVALEQLAALAPVPVRLTVETNGRLPEAIEVAAYYLVCESLANIGKYAHASSATVDVNRDERQCCVEVTDDGVGGADTERGSGLRGLADRVEALDGRLRIWSPAGGGTRVRAEIPCAP